MSRDSKIVFSIFSGWLSRGISIALNLFLVPVLFGNLEPDELGLWLFLAQTSAILSILDLGVSFTLVRRVAFSYSKISNDTDTDSDSSKSARRELDDLIISSRRIYSILAVVVFAFTVIIGCLYFVRLNLKPDVFFTTLSGWTILCLNNAFVLLSNRWVCILQGSGYVGWDSLVASFTSILTLVLQITFVMLGAGVIGLAIAVSAGSALQRLLLIMFAKHKRPDLFLCKGSWNSSIASSFVKPSLKAWVTGFCVAVSVHTDQFFVLAESGAESFPNYRAAYLVLMNLAMIACFVASASSAFISHAWQAGRFGEVQVLLLRNGKLALFTMGIGSVSVIALGESLFDFWLGANHFVGYPILLVFSISLFLETQAQVISMASRATEDEVFMYTSILSALLKIILAIVLPWYLGLFGIGLATMIAQLTTNHWYMVIRGLNRCRISIKQYFLQVLGPALGLMLITFLIGIGLRKLLFDTTPGAQTLSVLTASAFIWFSSVWLLVFDTVERKQVATYFMKKLTDHLPFATFRS